MASLLHMRVFSILFPFSHFPFFPSSFSVLFFFFLFSFLLPLFVAFLYPFNFQTFISFLFDSQPRTVLFISFLHERELLFLATFSRFLSCYSSHLFATNWCERDWCRISSNTYWMFALYDDASINMRCADFRLTNLQIKKAKKKKIRYYKSRSKFTILQ